MSGEEIMLAGIKKLLDSGYEVEVQTDEAIRICHPVTKDFKVWITKDIDFQVAADYTDSGEKRYVILRNGKVWR